MHQHDLRGLLAAEDEPSTNWVCLSPCWMQEVRVAGMCSPGPASVRFC